MTDRERWIVYPLLFLTLGIALRNQFLPTRRFGAVDMKAGELSAQKILCNELVVQEKGKCNQLQCGQIIFEQALGKYIRAEGLAEFAQLKAGHADFLALFIVDAEGKPVVMAGTDKNTQAGIIQTMNSNGIAQVRLSSTDSGGVVTTFGRGGKAVAMGHEGQNFGVFAQIPQVGIIPLTTPWRFEPKTSTPNTSPVPSPVTPPQNSNQPSSGKTP